MLFIVSVLVKEGFYSRNEYNIMASPESEKIQGRNEKQNSFGDRE
jgi:hypothetical protein